VTGISTPDGDHRAGHRVAQADQPVEALGQQGFGEAGAVGQQHGQGHGDEGGEARQGEAVAGQHQEALAELGVALAEGHAQEQCRGQQEAHAQG
jgi:hypothetical protein